LADSYLFQSAARAGDGQVSFCYTLATILSPLPASVGTFTQGDIGDEIFFNVQNSGSESTTGPVTLTYSLPAGLVAAGLSGPGWTNCTAAPVVGPGTLSCQLAEALGGDEGSPPLFLTVNVALDAPSILTNVVQVVGGGGTPSGPVVFAIPVDAAPIALVPALSGAGLAAFTALLSGFGVLLITRRRRRVSTLPTAQVSS
jgi:hypothetical protein